MSSNKPVTFPPYSDPVQGFYGTGHSGTQGGGYGGQGHVPYGPVKSAPLKPSRPPKSISTPSGKLNQQEHLDKESSNEYGVQEEAADTGTHTLPPAA